MNNNYFYCPYYQQCCENSMMRGQTRFGPPMGGPPMGGGGPMGGGMIPTPGAPPPKFTPQKAQGTKLGAQVPGGAQALVSGGSLYPCRYTYVYFWMNDGRGFWMWLAYVDQNTAAGFTWTPFGPSYAGIDLYNVDSFYCYFNQPQ